MAGNKYDLGNEGLDNFGMDSFDMGFKDPKDHRKPIAKIATSFADAARDQMGNAGTLRRMLKDALPTGYGKALGIAFDVHDSARKLYDTAAKELRPVLPDMKRAVNKVMPKLDKVLPKDLSERLKNATKEEERLGYTAKTDEERQNDAIVESLTDVFRTNIDYTARNEAQKAAYKKVRDQVQNDQFRLSHITMRGMSAGINRLVAYQDEVTSRYQKKSLELQYRQLFAIREQTTITQALGRDTVEQLKGILHNTYLPDMAKQSFYDREKNTFKQRIVGAMFPGAQEFVGKYMSNLTENFVKQMKSSLGTMVMGARAAADGFSNPLTGELPDASTTVGGAAGHAASSWLSDKITPHVRRLLQKHAGVKRMGEMLNYTLSDPYARLNDFARSGTTKTGFLGGALNLLKGAMPKHVRDDKLGDSPILSANEPAVFNMHARRALTDVIPGFLSRIHHELAIIRTGNANAERMVYNQDRGHFTTLRASANDMSNRLFDKGSLDRVKHSTNMFLDTVDDKGALSKEAREAIHNQALDETGNARAFDTKNYVQALKGASPKVQKEVADHFRNKFKLNPDGSVDTRKSDYSALAKSSDFHQFIRSQAPDPHLMAQAYMEAGYGEQLHSLGLARKDGTTDRFNYDKVGDIYSGKKARPTFQDIFSPEAGMARGPMRGSYIPTPDVDREKRDASIEELTRTLKDKFENYKPDNTNMDVVVAALREQSVKAEAMKSTELLAKILDVLENREFAFQGSGAAAMGVGSKSAAGETAAVKGRWGSKLFDRFRKGHKWQNVKDVAGGAGRAVSGGAGLGMSAIRGIGGGLGSYYHGLGHAVGGTARLAGRITGGIWHRLHPKVKDVYVKGEKDPSLVAKKIIAGDYINAKDGSTIHSLDDIKGPVMDEDGNYALTKEDFEKGLTDVHGKSVLKKIAGLAGFLGRGLGAAFGLQFRGIGAIARLAGRIVGGVGGGIYKRATKRVPMDVYVGNETTPRLLAIGMKKGEYHLLSDPKKIVKCPADITGPVIGKDGNILIREDELSELRTPHGLLRKTAGLAGRALGGILRAQLGVVKFAGRAVAGIGRGVMGFLGHGVRGIFPGHVGKKSKDPVDILLSSLSTQRAIFKLIHERIPKPEHLRAGSWEQRFLKKGHDDMNSSPGAKAGVSGKGKMAGVLGWLRNKLHRKKSGGLVNDAENKIENVAEGAAGGLVMRGAKALGRGIGNVGKWAKNLVRGGGEGAIEGAGETAVEGAGETALAGAGETAAVGLGDAAAAGLGETAVAAGLGDAALGLGAAALTAIGAPVLLAAGAVAALGIGAWYAYKWFKNRGPHPLLAVRMAQYGVNPKDSDQAKKVANLENTLEKHVSYGSDGASIDSKSFTLKKLVTDFGVNLADTKAVQEWFNWYTYRFKVVFLTNMAALNKIDPKASLANVDKDLAPEKKMSFLNAIHVNAGFYKVPYNPFGKDSSVVVGEGPVTAAFKAAADEITKETKKDSKSSPGWFSKTLTNIGNGIRSAAAGFLSAIGLSSLAKDVAPKEADKKKPQEIASDKAKGLMAKAGAVGAVTAKISGQVAPIAKIGGTTLTALQSVRYKTYGLVEMTGEHVKALFTLETDMMDKITFSAKGQATFDDDPSVYYDTYSSMFGLTANDVVAKKDWVNWFISRFMPTLLQYATAVRLANPNINVLDADRSLKPDQQLDVAKSTMNAKAEVSMGKMSVWSISVSPWPNYKLNMDSKSVQPNIDYLKSLVDKMVFDEKAAAAKAKTAGKPPTPADGSAKPGANATKPNGGSTAANAQTAKTNTATSIQAQSVGNQPSSNGDYTTSAGEGGSGSFGKGTPGGGSGAPGKSMGAMIPEPGNGTGGDINKIPLPGPGRGWSAAAPTIEAAAKMSGMDPKLLGTIASIESGFNPSVKAGTSSATGYFQFVSGTWRSMLNKYGKKYGISPDTPPSDPRANALMGAEYTRENQEYLERRLGRKVTDTELYLAHFLGAGGAYNLLKAPADANAAAAFPSAARANPAIFKDGGRDRTVQEVIALMDHKVKAHSVSVGGGASNETSSTKKPGSSGGITGLPKGNGMASSVASARSSTVAPSKRQASSSAMGGGGGSKLTGSPSALTNTPVPTIDRSMSIGSGSSDTTDADTVETRRSQAMQSAAVADDQQRKTITSDNTKSADVATLLTQGLQTWLSMDGTLKLMLKAMSSGTTLGSNSPTQAGNASNPSDTSPAAVGVSPSSSSKGPAQMAAQAPVDVSRKTG